MNFKKSINLKNDRMFCEIEEFRNDKDNKQLIVSNTIIESLFYSYYIAYSQNNIEDMGKSIQNLTEIAKNQQICYLPQLDQYNIFQIIAQSLYLPNIQYHDSLLTFFLFVSQYDQFLNYFIQNKLLLYLIDSITIFQEKKLVLLHSFAVLNEISIQSKKYLHELLNISFIYLFLKLFQDANLSQEEKISIFSVVANMAQDKLSKMEMNNLLILLRQIFDDKAMNFMWEKSFETLDLLIASRETAEYVMIEKELYIQCSQIVLAVNNINIIKSIIYVLKSYFKHSSYIFTGIDNILGKIIQLSKLNEVLHPTLCLLKNLIRQNHLPILMNFDIFNLLKFSFQEGEYQIKKKTLNIMSYLIRQLSNEQIIQIIIPFNFMDDFVQILSANNLHKIFNKSIGIIARLLRSNINYEPRDIFWIQFEMSGGVDILYDLINSDDQELASRASWFLEKIYSLRPPHDESK